MNWNTPLINDSRYVWYAVIAFCVLAVAAACLTIDYGQYLNDDVARKMHGRTTGAKQSGPGSDGVINDKSVHETA